MSNPYTQGTNQPSDGKKAVALLYDQLRAPLIKAKGEGELAWEICAWRKKWGYVAEDPILAETLSYLQLEEEIPEEVYRWSRRSYLGSITRKGARRTIKIG